MSFDRCSNQTNFPGRCDMSTPERVGGRCRATVAQAKRRVVAATGNKARPLRHCFDGAAAGGCGVLTHPLNVSVKRMTSVLSGGTWRWPDTGSWPPDNAFLPAAVPPPMNRPLAALLALAVSLCSCAIPPSSPPSPGTARRAVDVVDTLVVIYAENRAFDTLFARFPGANGIPGINPSSVGSIEPQRDVDGSVLPVLPPVWGGLTAAGQTPVVSQAQTTGMPNRPFPIDGANAVDGHGVALPIAVTTRDLVHRFYNNMMQIDSGRNDLFATYSDAGGLAMGYYDGSNLAMWKIARQYTLADNFFMGAFGGSFLNHQYLVCACAPEVPDAEASAAKELISEVDVDAQGRVLRLTPAAGAARSGLDGPPLYRRDGALTAKDSSGRFY